MIITTHKKTDIVRIVIYASDKVIDFDSLQALAAPTRWPVHPRTCQPHPPTNATIRPLPTQRTLATGGGNITTPLPVWDRCRLLMGLQTTTGNLVSVWDITQHLHKGPTITGNTMPVPVWDSTRPRLPLCHLPILPPPLLPVRRRHVSIITGRARAGQTLLPLRLLLPPLLLRRLLLSLLPVL